MQTFRVTILVLGFVFLSCTAFAQSNWTLQNSGVTVPLRNVKALSPSTCWAAGDEGTVLCTTDSGNTWNSVGGGIIGTSPIYALTAVSDSIAMVSTTTPTATYIYRTTDAGTSWTEVYSLSGSFINGIRMFDTLNGIAEGDPVSGKFLILKTTNAGESWTELNTEPDAADTNEYGLTTSLCIRDNNFIWFGTVNITSGIGRVIFSTDLGTTWAASTTPFFNVRNVWFNDSLVGLIDGEIDDTTSGIAKSINGGNSWSVIPGDYNFLAVAGDGFEKYFGLGSVMEGTYGIYESPDTSFNWSNVFAYDGGGGSLWDISVGKKDDNYFGWAVSTNGDVVGYNELITDVKGKNNVISGFALYQNYPNPFNPSTNIKFQIGRSENTTIKVYDLLGNEISTLVDRYLETGNYEIEFNAEQFSTGIYFYQIISGNYIDTKKLILLK